MDAFDFVLLTSLVNNIHWVLFALTSYLSFALFWLAQPFQEGPVVDIAIP